MRDILQPNWAMNTAYGKTKSEANDSQVQLSGTMDDLRALAKQCATFLLGHNVERDAVDLLEEMEKVQEIIQLVYENTF